MHKEEMNLLVLEAIDEGLEILGGKQVIDAFYYHVEKRAKMKKDDIPCKLGAFHDVLKDLFEDGSSILEKRMARHLYNVLGLGFKEKAGWTFSDYVNAVTEM
jgi:hypothetical protein